MKKLIIFGTSGHSSVVTDIAAKNGYKIIAYINTEEKLDKYLDKPVYKSVEELPQYNKYLYFIAIGNNSIRKKIFEQYNFLKYANIIDKTACISKNAIVGYGCLIMPYVVVNTNAVVGKHCILNTACVVEHDCKIEDYCHISINCSISGTVKVGEGTFIGAGTVVRNNTNIGKWITIGAGASVVNNLENNKVYVGCPAKELIKK